MIVKKNSLFVILIFTLYISCAGKPSGQEDLFFLDYVPTSPYLENDYPSEPLSGKTAFDYFTDEEIAAGWNLGNTFDAHNNGVSGETFWGNPPVNQALMDGVKAAGFDIIRIPITWMGRFGEGPDFRIQPSLLERVAEVIEMAHNAGLKVIINMHHDSSTTNVDIGWLSIRQAARNQEQFNRITSQYVRLWEQIAIYFKDYGDWLIFEGLNELHDGGWGGSGDTGQYIVLAKWSQLFVDIVRQTGGNNADRFLVVTAYCNDRRQLLSSFVMPKDSSAGKLIVSFHSYDPYAFGIEGSRSAWGTAADKQQVESDFAPLKGRFTDKNIQVILGECGAVLQLYPNDPAKETEARNSRKEYMQHIFGTAKKNGIVPIYWDNGSTSGGGEKFGILNRNTGHPNSTDNDALIKLMIDAVR